MSIALSLSENPAPAAVMPAAEAVCYHCQTPLASVPKAEVVHAQLAGEPRDFCCTGCQLVAETIHAGGLAHFYAHRAGLDVAAKWSDSERAATEIYDDPAMATRFVRTVRGEGVEGEQAEVEVTLVMENIRCAACVWLNEQHLLRQPGIVSAQVNYATRRATVRWRPSQIKLSQILQTMAQIGYRAWPYAYSEAAVLAKKERASLLMRMAVAVLGMMQVMMYAWPVYWHSDEVAADHVQLMRWASFILTLPVMLYSAWPIFAGAWRDAKNRHLGMDVPVAIGIGAAFFASAWATVQGQGEVYFDSVTMFVGLLLGARYLELRARQNAVSGAEELARQVPASCTVLTAFDADAPETSPTETRPVAQLAVGDYVKIRAGEGIPADGEIVHGETDVEEALLTGESRPIHKIRGATVLAGSHNRTSPIVLRVSKIGEQTRLAEIVRLLDRALAEKPRMAVLADKVALWFVAALLLLALLTGVFWAWHDASRILPIVVAVLVVSCPCALSLATPAALAVAHGALAKQGLLVTRGHALETLAQVSDVLLDKTGTLTEGRFALLEQRRLNAALTTDEALALAAALEQDSEHPIAHAFTQAYEQSLRGATAASAFTDKVGRITAVRNVPGQGIEALWQQSGTTQTIRLGRADFVAAFCKVAAPIEASQQSPHTSVYLGGEAGWFAQFVLGDALRPEANILLRDLAAQGKTVHLISGDSAATVAWWAQSLGISAWQGDVTPEGKKAYVEALQAQGKVVLAVGDGINDAPVLAAAQVSVAIGSGAPLAQAGADAVLAHGGIAVLGQSARFATRVQAVIKQNLLWAFAYNVTAIPLAAMGYVSPWLAGVGMSLSSLFVVLNAGRLASRWQRF